MPTILITGSNGQVGQEFQALAEHHTEFNFIFTDVRQLDITNQAMVNTFFEQQTIDYCVNCAAYTAVDKAESEVVLAKKVNVDGAQNLAIACRRKDIPFIHLSTDYVYHNEQNIPFKEEDHTNPQGVYAQTKLDGDLAVLEQHKKVLILRTSWVYSTYGGNFVKTMLRLGSEREHLNVIFDQIGTPTYAKDIADCIFTILQKIAHQSVDIRQVAGIYHFSNEGVTSWYDFAKAIFDLQKIDCEVFPIETKDYPTPAKRPPFSVLNKEKIKNTFNITIPYWRDSLQSCLEQLH